MNTSDIRYVKGEPWDTYRTRQKEREELIKNFETVIREEIVEQIHEKTELLMWDFS